MDLRAAIFHIKIKWESETNSHDVRLWVKCRVGEKSRWEDKTNIYLAFWKVIEFGVESSIAFENLNNSLIRVLVITIS